VSCLVACMSLLFLFSPSIRTLQSNLRDNI
jgi:hypothetical protein